MTFLKYSFITLLTIVLIGSVGYLLAAGGMQSKPGFAKLDLPSWLSTKTTLALDLGPRGLKPVQWTAKRVISVSDYELELSARLIMSLLEDLQGVQIRLYEVEGNRPVFDHAIDDSITTLKQGNWQTLFSVRENDKRIVVMQAKDEGAISGLSIFASTPENAVFINLVGQLTPKSIAIIEASLISSNVKNIVGE
ncbi:MAG: hypothetical protein ACI9OI_002418 [Chitinophagales bacterium]|jgi:hypothetical protein